MDKKNIPNESEAIRASGNLSGSQVYSQHVQTNSSQKYTNNYISFINKTKGSQQTGGSNEKNRSGADIITNDEAQLHKQFISNRSPHQQSERNINISTQGYMTNPVEFKQVQRQRQSMQNLSTSQVPPMFDFDASLSEDITDDQNEGARRRPYTLESSNNDKALEDLSRNLIRGNESQTSSQYNLKIKERQLEVENKLMMIQKQVEQKQQELNEFRMKNKFMGVNKDIFKPFNKSKGMIKEEEIEQLVKLADKSGKPMMRPETMLQQSHRPSLKNIEQQVLQMSKELSTLPKVPMPTKEDNLEYTMEGDPFRDTIRESNVFVQDEQSPNTFVQEQEAPPRKHSINVSQFLSGGGLSQYRQNTQYTSRSQAGKKWEMINQTPQAAMSQRDKFTSSKFELQSPKSNRYVVMNSNLKSQQLNTEKNANRAKLTNLQGIQESMTELIQTPKEPSGSYRETREQILSGQITDVLLHPQDMRRLGLSKEQVSSPANLSNYMSTRQLNKLGIQKCTSVKSLKSSKSQTQMMSKLKTDREQVNHTIPVKQQQVQKNKEQGKKSPTESKVNNKIRQPKSGKTGLSQSFISQASSQLMVEQQSKKADSKNDFTQMTSAARKSAKDAVQKGQQLPATSKQIFKKVDDIINRNKNLHVKKSLSPKPVRPTFKHQIVQNDDNETIQPSTKQRPAVGNRKSSSKVTSNEKHKKNRSKAFDINVGDGLKVPANNNAELSAELPLNINLNTSHCQENLEQTTIFNMPKFEKSGNNEDLTKLQKYLNSRSANQDQAQQPAEHTQSIDQSDMQNLSPNEEDKLTKILNELEDQTQDCNIFETKLSTLCKQNSISHEEREQLLKQLLDLEKYIFNYTTQPFDHIQSQENKKTLKQHNMVDFKTILQKAGIDKIRVMFFVRQMQITFMLTKAFVRMFPNTLLQRFQVKLQHICQNIHQNFLLTINMVLRSLYSESQTLENTERNEYFSITDRTSSLTKSDSYRILRKIVEEKLRTKEKQVKSLTSFRQNNEVNIQNLKKVVKYLCDSYSNESVNLKVMAEEAQEIIKKHLNNAIANLNTKNFDQETSLPTSSIDYLNKQMHQRCEQVLQAASVVNMSFDAGSQKKRPKSNVKVFSPEKSSPSKAYQLVNSYKANNSKSFIEADKQPQRIDDLINAANQGQHSGVLASRKSAKKQHKLTAQKEMDEPISPNTSSKMSQSIMYSETKRAGSSSIIYDQARPNSPSMIQKDSFTRKKYTGGSKGVQKTSNSALGQASTNQTKRATVANAYNKGDHKTFGKKHESIQSKFGNSSFNSPMKSMSKKQSPKGTVQKADKSSFFTDRKKESNKTPLHQTKKAPATSNQRKQQEDKNANANSQNLNWIQQSFSLPETLAFIQDHIKNQSVVNNNQSVVNNNINIYGPVVNCVHSGSPSDMICSPQSVYQDAEEKASDLESNESELDDQQREQKLQEEMRELDLLDKMRSNQHTVLQTKLTSKKNSHITRKDLDENIIESSQSSAIKTLQQSQQSNRAGVNSRQTHESFLKPPSRQREVSPLGNMDPVVKNHVISPAKSYRVNTGIGSGIKNLILKQEKSNLEKRNEHVYDRHIQILQESNESEQPPQPQQISSVIENVDEILQSRHSRELNEFQQIEQEILSSQNSHQMSMSHARHYSFENKLTPSCPQDEYESPDYVKQMTPSDQDRSANQFSPFKESDARKEVTEPRRFKKRQDTANSLYAESQHTLPRSKKISKRYFLGEYDATAEEEQSLINSQNNKHGDRANRKTVGSPEEISSFVQNDNQNDNSSPAQSRGGMSSHKPSESIHETQSNNLLKTSTLHALGPLSLIVNSPRDIEDLSSKRVSIMDQLTDNGENANSENEQDAINLPSEIKVSETRKTAENKIVEAISRLTSSPLPQQAQQQIEEEDEEYEETQVLSIVPQNMENKPTEEMFNTNNDRLEEPPEEVDTLQTTLDHQKQLEQDEIDAEWRMLREQVKYPYLPPLTSLKKLPKFAKDISQVYTLVLDLDETLIHFDIDEGADDEEEAGYYNIRPGAIRFLGVLSDHFEVVVFTAAMPDYADWILDDIDRAGKISHRLYRQHTTPHEDYAIKDLKNLGRDLSRTIIIDNLAENFNYTTPLNGIWVESWYDDMDDNVLGLLIPFLKQVVENKVDVRLLLTEFLKEQYIYKHLDEQRPIPNVNYLLAKSQLSQMQEVFDNFEYTQNEASNSDLD